jgi:CRP-like cAMP-binding protein
LSQPLSNELYANDPVFGNAGGAGVPRLDMPANLFAKRIKEAVGLSPSDHEALRSLRVTERTLGNRELLCREGDVATQCTIILSGFLTRYKIVGDREQILSIHLPGDFPDLQTLQLSVLDHSIISIGPLRVGQVSHSQLQGILDASPKLARVFWRETLKEAAIFREWVCNVAARDALGSIAHLICEIATRLDVVGLVENDSFQFPFTQQDIASATGISAVHVNRTLQLLRSRSLIAWESRTLRIFDFEELKRIADFNPDYLHLHAEPSVRQVI